MSAFEAKTQTKKQTVIPSRYSIRFYALSKKACSTDNYYG